jgi:putative ABC transport system permease protein
LTVAHVIEAEPDRAPSMLNIAPRAMVGLAELESMDLLGPGTRATWRLQVAGDTATVAAFRQYIVDQLAVGRQIGVQVQTLEQQRADMQGSLGRAESFLSLTVLLAATLAVVAIALAARRFVLRHLGTCAMLRCLGLSQGQMVRLFALEMAMLGVAGAGLGTLLGYGSHQLLLHWLAEWMPGGGLLLADFSWRPAVQGLTTALVLLAGFALPQLMQLRGVTPLAVMRRERSVPRASALVSAGLGLLAFAAVMLWQTGDWQMTLAAVLGLPVLACLFGLCAWLGLLLLERLRPLSTRAAWRFAIVSLCRRPLASIVQLVALSISLAVLLLLTVVQADLLQAWERSAPPDAPNHYIAGIQPEQIGDVTGQLGSVAKPTLHATIRGRLVLVDGKPPRSDDGKAAHEEALDEREWDVSPAAALPAWNSITAGRWPAAGSTPQFSLDQSLAKREGLAIGNVLTFDFAGETVSGPITSLRKLDWRSREGNFPLLVNADAVPQVARSYLGTVRVQPAQRHVLDQLALRYPNLTILDIGVFVEQVQHLMAQLTAAVKFLSLFVLLAGLLVLYAALAASQDERRHQAAVLRALGATRRTLQHAQWLEQAMTGILAGVLAAGAATAGNWALARFVFKLEWQWSPLLWGAAVLAGAICALCGGWLGLRTILNQPPLQSLRHI